MMGAMAATCSVVADGDDSMEVTGEGLHRWEVESWGRNDSFFELPFLLLEPCERHVAF